MKELVIAEKPSVARDIARVLKCNKKINGGLEGEHFIVTWALGHLVTLADPEQYSARYKEWNMEDLPMVPEHFKVEVIKKTNKQYQAVKQLLWRKDVVSVIIATDAGREGELVARFILLKAGNKKPLKRLWISSVTDRAIKDGFARLKDGREYNHLYDAALSRAQADWLVGINATRALTCKHNAQLSCGRVQTPTLAMIATREEEIKNFKPQTFFGLQLSTGKEAKCSAIFTWQDQTSKSYQSFDKERMDGMYSMLKQETVARVLSVNKKEKKEYAPLLYDLTELQRDANRAFGYSAKQTLNYMQRLYEYHKVLTYPRTDSRYVTEDIIDTLKDRLRACCVGEYKKVAGKLIGQSYSKKAFFVNDSKVSDHHAIIPTEEAPNILKMSNEEKKIYDMVVKRFLSVLMPPFEYEQTTATVKIKNEHFIAKGKVVKNLGFKALSSQVIVSETEGETQLLQQQLPVFEMGQELSVNAVKLTTGKTAPPARFNEATLLSAMEHPARYMETKNQNYVKMLGESGGLGTVATRADIIEKLFSSYLIEKQGKDILLTSKGKQLLSLVPQDLKQPELTADWEMKLSKIAKGSLKKEQFMKEIKEYSQKLIDDIKEAKCVYRHDNITNHKCPECGKKLLQVKGKNSTMLVCQDRECGYKETISRVSNARCPVCHKKMELRGKGEAQTFVCGCGYKEKLAAFTARRKKEGAGVSKKDVQKYINKQKKENEPLNDAFAQAFAKLNLK